MSFRSFLNQLDRADELRHVEEETSPNFEVAKTLDNSKDAFLFENVEGHEIRVAGNVYGSRERVARGLETEKSQIIEKLRKSLSDLQEPDVVSEAPVQEIVEDDIDLERYPILKHFEEDGGSYVTSSIIVAKDSEGNRNLSFHRLQQIDQDKFTIRLVPRHLHKLFKESEEEGKSLEVVAILGVDIGLALASATSPSYETDEYEIANNLSKELELTKCQLVDLEVPAEAEIVMEGRLLAEERAPEGPFSDITGTYDAVRQQPVFEVDLITRREDSIYPALLPGSSEHQLLMGMPREPLIYEEVDKVTEAEDVALTPGGCGWLHSVVSIDKQEDDEGKQAIQAAFEGHSSLKHVVIVDKDIDIHDYQEVEWAIATRVRADRDVVIKSEVKGSSLDPTADSETRLGSKMGIDATKDLENKQEFERAQIPERK